MLVNKMVSALGLRVEDYDGEAFNIQVANGATQKVSNLGELWHAVERLHGAPVDPLSPQFLKAGQT